ncbi:Tautomerase/MIF superfamily [Favolaschia claudopus]|uniref:L-dopachrome isomerase n=1 Tax=Favolaschia claudopus TaxID=2862362 RepID=A0AAW0BD03_9AGAR
MPVLELVVNIEVPDHPEVSLKLTRLAARLLNRPEARIATYISTNKTLTFAGTSEPAYLLTVIAIECLDTQANVTYSSAFAEFFESDLGLAKDRGYIIFEDPGSDRIGLEGTTWAALNA